MNKDDERPFYMHRIKMELPIESSESQGPLEEFDPAILWHAMVASVGIDKSRIILQHYAELTEMTND